MAKDRIEIITSVERRRRWQGEDKARLVAAMNEPGAVVTEIARSASVSASLLYRWRRQLAVEGGRPMFVPVRVAVEGAGAAGATMEAEPRASSGPSPALGSITIAFGAQVRVTIEGAPDAGTLSSVISALVGHGGRR